MNEEDITLFRGFSGKWHACKDWGKKNQVIAFGNTAEEAMHNLRLALKGKEKMKFSTYRIDYNWSPFIRWGHKSKYYKYYRFIKIGQRIFAIYKNK